MRHRGVNGSKRHKTRLGKEKKVVTMQVQKNGGMEPMLRGTRETKREGGGEGKSLHQGKTAKDKT